MDAPAAVRPDLDQRQLIQQQLILLLHAYKCQKRENNPNDISEPCELRHCRTLKEVINHIRICQNGRRCPVPHCSSSVQIIGHWKSCLVPDCPVCAQIRHADDAANDTKEWHQSIAVEERRHLVNLLVDALSSSTDGVVYGRIIQNKVECAEIIENRIYKEVNTLSEYYRMLAAKKWDIEMDIEARRRRQAEIWTELRNRRIQAYRRRQSDHDSYERVGRRAPWQPNA